MVDDHVKDGIKVFLATLAVGLAIALVMLGLVLAFISYEPDRTKLGCETVELYDGNSVLENEFYVKKEWVKKNISSWGELPQNEKEKLVGRLRSTLNASSYQRNKSEIINQMLERYKRDLNEVGNMTRYSDLTQRDREIFDEALDESTDLADEEPYLNSTAVNESEIRSFLPGPGIYESRGIIYRNEVYVCDNVAPYGVA